MLRAFDDLGESQIKSGRRLRSGIHRCAEARVSRLAAVHGQEECAFAARFVERVDKGSAEKHFVLNGDGVQLAGAHADESHLGRRVFFFFNLDVFARPVRLP